MKFMAASANSKTIALTIEIYLYYLTGSTNQLTFKTKHRVVFSNFNLTIDPVIMDIYKSIYGLLGGNWGQGFIVETKFNFRSCGNVNITQSACSEIGKSTLVQILVRAIYVFFKGKQDMLVLTL